MTESGPEAEAAASGLPAGAPDAEIVTRLLARDEATYVGLVRGYYSSMLRLAQLFVAERATAEEIIQDTWAAVLERLPSFEGRSRLKTWVFRILVNRAKTRGDREARSVPMSDLGEDEPAVHPGRFDDRGRWRVPPLDWDMETPERQLLRKEVLLKLRDAIGALPPNQQAVLLLRDVEGCAHDEVCDVLEVSESNQRVLLHRARAKVRSALEAYLEREGRSC